MLLVVCEIVVSSDAFHNLLPAFVPVLYHRKVHLLISESSFSKDL
jgi:hypothetical protein